MSRFRLERAGLLLTAALVLTMACAGGGKRCEPAPGTICTVAGTGIAGAATDDNLPALKTDLYLPLDVTVSPTGDVYLIDWNNHRIRGLSRDGRLPTVVGSGRTGDGPPGPVREAGFNHPTDLAFDAQGRMLIAGWHASRITRADLDTGKLEFYAGAGPRTYSGDNGPATQATMDLPKALAFDPRGNLYFLDQGNQVVRRIDTAGIVTRFAGFCIAGDAEVAEGAPRPLPNSDKWGWTEEDATKPCNADFQGDGGPALQARFSEPGGQSAEPSGGIAFDAAGNLYIADSGNHRIRKVDLNGVITTIAGTGTAGAGGDGGPAVQAQLNNPTDIEVAVDGTLYIADTYNSCVRAVDTRGVIRTVAGVCGNDGFAGDGSAADKALLKRPYGIGLDKDMNLYIADTYNNRIRLVSR